MSLQNLIEEREKELNENFEWTDFSGDLGNFVLVKKQSDYSTEDTQRNDLKKFHSTSINLILDGVVEMVNEELEIQNKIQEKAKEIVVVGRQKVNEMLQDKYIRQGKIEALNNIISQLQTLKK